MNKVAIVTLYRDNFGSILQAYSTYSFVERLGDDCTILEFKYSSGPMDKMVKIPKFLYKCIRYKGYIYERKRFREAVDREKNLLSLDTKKKMDEFIEYTFKIKACENRNLRVLNEKFDFFITGSDQVWNGYDKFRYLVFADKKKKVALAPSFGGNTIKSYDKKNIKKAINEYLEKNDCTAYCICNKYDTYNQLLRYEFIDVNPYDYVSLIDSANFVFTDSFHSTLFSINLETNFLTFDRQHFHGVSQRSRIIDLLNRVEMQYKFVTEDKEHFIFESTKKWSSDLIFKQERDNIKNYIKTELK